MLVAELQDIDVHQQPVIRVLTYQSSDRMSEPHEVGGLKRFSQLSKHLVESGIDYFLIPADNGFKDLLLRAVVVVNVAQGYAGTRGNGARRCSVKALLYKERLGGFLNAEFSVVSQDVVQFWHKAEKQKKTNVCTLL